MKIKLKFNRANIFRILYIILIISNLIILFYLYKYLNKYIYRIIKSGPAIMLQAGSQATLDINMNKLEEIITKIDKKSNNPQSVKIKNIFK